MSGYLYGLDPHTPIFRIVPVHRFLTDLSSRSTRLVRPSTWEDPQEDAISWMAFSYTDAPAHQLFGGQYLPPAFAQSWSRNETSDPMWRAYSRVRHNASGRQDDPNEEGLQIRSTPAKLLGGLMKVAPAKGRSFVGSVRYVPRAGVSQDIVNEVASQGLDSFVDPVKRAFVALYKRDAFAHEDEVRLIYIGNTMDAADLVLPWDHNATVEAISLDGRVNETEQRERDQQLRDAGYRGPIAKSELYQRVLWEVPLPAPPVEKVNET